GRTTRAGACSRASSPTSRRARPSPGRERRCRRRSRAAAPVRGRRTEGEPSARARQRGMVSGPNKAVSAEALRPLAGPVGPRLERVLTVAYRARRAVLLEGPTGVGKSEIVRSVADALGMETIVLDLSLLEPPDLVGLPVVRDGRTEYALPRALPK